MVLLAMKDSLVFTLGHQFIIELCYMIFFSQFLLIYYINYLNVLFVGSIFLTIIFNHYKLNTII